MSKPLIAIVGNQYEFAEEVFHHHPATYVPQFYVDAVVKAGGIPVILPLTDREAVPTYVAAYDGFLLTGGQGVSPFLYGKEPQPLMGETSLRRDRFELDLVRAVQQTDKPLLGICRGEQVLNVGLGGTLHQDISYVPGAHIKHMQVPTRDTQVSHYVTAATDSYLARAFGPKFLVNSLHSQAVAEVAPGMEAIAQASDGIVEAIQSTDARHRLFGVQWHPEMLLDDRDAPEQLAIFARLIQLAEHVE